MDEDEAAAVAEQHVRAVLGLADDEPIPRGPLALAIERARERERRFAEQVRELQVAFAPAWEQVVRLAQRESGSTERAEIVWRDPTAPSADRGTVVPGSVQL